MSDFNSTDLYSDIKTAAEKHKNQQLNFRFKAPEMLLLLNHLKKTPETEDLIKTIFQDALEKSDKRPMTEQLTLKAKYQKSHGLVFKDIPIGVERHIIFDAILKLGRTMDFESGRLMFPGGCKLRSFFFPQIKHKEQTHRVCFPIFVNKKDQMFIYQWAQNQNGKIQLEVDRSCNWDGVVSVELTRDAEKDDDDTQSVASGVSNFSSHSKFMNPLMGQNPNPFMNPFALPFTHGGPISPNPFNMHPNLIAHQSMLQNQANGLVSPVMTSTIPTATKTTKVEELGASLNSLSVKDSDNYSQSESPQVEPAC